MESVTHWNVWRVGLRDPLLRDPTHYFILQVPVELVGFFGGEQLQAPLLERLLQLREAVGHSALLTVHLHYPGVLLGQGQGLRLESLHLLLTNVHLMLQHLKRTARTENPSVSVAALPTGVPAV